VEDLPVDLQRMLTALASVKSELRGLSQDQAEERLVSALRRHHAFFPRSEIRLLARDMRAPWWRRRHPLRALREARRVLDEPDPESERFEAEAVRLSLSLQDVSGVTGLSSRRTMDGIVHIATIHPWSEELARHVRELSAPVSVTVRPRR
jgi:hypothetical protein